MTSNAYPSGHLVPSPILGLANAPIVETKFLELAMSLLDFSPRIPLGTFSVLLPMVPGRYGLERPFHSHVAVVIVIAFHDLFDLKRKNIYIFIVLSIIVII